uniref:5-formyltetrahydrofolate cyclo-ligase isoform X3 n=1 Tax=Pristiophorus japonicus TaxID=55135 RepID=UPI00398E44C3
MEAEAEAAAHGPGTMATLRAAKKVLRLDMKRRVAALSGPERQRQTEAVSRRLIAHPKYQNCQRIAVFLSMSDEIQTEDIIKDVFQRGKECFIPRYKPRSNHMDMVKLGSAEEIQHLPLTSWNIRQPAEDNSLEEALTSAAPASSASSGPCSSPSSVNRSRSSVCCTNCWGLLKLFKQLARTDGKYWGCCGSPEGDSSKCIAVL